MVVHLSVQQPGMAVGGEIMALHRRISGPLFVQERHRRERRRFLLLLSNLSGNTVLIGVQVYAAPFTNFGTPDTWVKILDKVGELEPPTIVTFEIPVSREFAYYQFHVDNSLPNTCFHPTLYLLRHKSSPWYAVPLVKGNEWELQTINP
jgi:hypothetical protein